MVNFWSYRNALVEHQDSKCMATCVEPQLGADTKHYSKGMHIIIDVFLIAQREHGLASSHNQPWCLSCPCSLRFVSRLSWHSNPVERMRYLWIGRYFCHQW